jgi:hypothetical protein
MGYQKHNKKSGEPQSFPDARFAITVVDRYLDVLQVLVARAWRPVKVFTSKVDGRLNSNAAVIDSTRRLAVDVRIGDSGASHELERHLP